MTFAITLADVKTKGLAALDAKQLSAQGPTPACAYRDESGRPCIIGTAIPDELIYKDMNTGYDVGELDEVFDFKVEDAEYDALTRIQLIHDRWAQIASGLASPDDHHCSLQGLTAQQLEELLRKELTA